MIDDFKNAMQSSGLEPPKHIEPGRFHRFPGIGKRNGNTAGWCKLFPDGQGGTYGDYSTGLAESWRAEREQPLAKAEREAFRRQVEESRRQAEAQRRREQEEAATTARRRWEAAPPASPDHPYLAKKHIAAHRLRQDGDKLLVPLRDESGQVWALQTIGPDGCKLFAPAGCRTKDLYFSIGQPTPGGTVCIVEGFATGAAIHEATGGPVACALTSGNLEPVARIIKGKLPGNPVVICADDDQKPGTDKNPGIEAANKAAQAVGGAVAVPGMDEKADFWDLWHERGADAVWAAIKATAPVTEREDVAAPLADQGRQVPIPDLPAVQPFDYDLLPAKLAPWVQDIAERMQCPPDYVAVGAMVNLAAVIGRKVAIRPQQRDNWTVAPNLWGVIVGRPGVMKSPALEATSGPLDRLVAEALAEFKGAEREAKAQKARAKLRAEAREKAARKKLASDPDADVSDLLTEDDAEEPTLRRYRTNDTTAASLGELLRQNPNGLLVYRDEMVSLLKNLDREDNAGERGFYLTAWNGDSSYTHDRIGRGLHLHIEACCISLLGGTQPGKIAGYINQAVRGGSGDDGLIQRFSLMTWPDVKPGWQNIDRHPDPAAKNAAYEVFDRLDKLSPKGIGAEQDTGFDGTPEGVPFLRFTPEAMKLFVEWRTNLEIRLRSGELHPALESHFAKYRKLVPALALIIHLADDGVGPVGEEPTLKALAWAEYLESHAKRCYGSATQAEAQAAKAILARIEKGDLKTPFSTRDVWRPGWTGLNRVAAAEGVSLFVDYGHLTVETIETSGRPATRYHVAKVAA